MPEPTPEAIERHPHLAEPRADGTVRVDMHCHTMWSGDSTTTPDEVKEFVAAAALDVLCITDHNTTNGAFALADELPCRVVIAEEVKTHAGEIIGLFLTERIPIGLQPLAVVEAIKEQGGLVYIPHPFDPLRNNLRTDVLTELVDAGFVDAIEGLNGKTSLGHLNQQGVDFGREHGLAVGAGSDAHVPEAFGTAYVEMPDFDGPESFLAALRQGRLVGRFFDAPRVWRPRIVPSTKAT